FVQAEDGIRDFHVTGVQTCALPISPAPQEMTPSPPANHFPWADTTTSACPPWARSRPSPQDASIGETTLLGLPSSRRRVLCGQILRPQTSIVFSMPQQAAPPMVAIRAGLECAACAVAETSLPSPSAPLRPSRVVSSAV